MSLKVGIAGLVRGQIYIDCFRAQKDVEVSALCDSNEQFLYQVGKRFNVSDLYTQYEKFLKTDIDVVIVATPLPLHVKHSVAALNADKHVLSEMPPVNSIEEGESLFKAAKKAKTKYMLAENACYWAHIQSWKQMIAEGRIGEIMYAEAEYIHDCRAYFVNEANVGKTWRVNMPLIYYCTHGLGPLLYLMDDRCISAQGFQTKGHFAKTGTTADMEVGIFKTKRGAIIKILVGFSVVREPAFHYYSIYGNKGCLETNRGGKEEKTLAYFEDIPHLKQMVSIPLPSGYTGISIKGGHGGSEYILVKDFVESILHDRPSPIGAEKALSYGLPGICAHQSAMNEGGVVKIPIFKENK